MKKLSLIISLTLLSAAALISMSCSCSACGQQEEADVPSDILSAGNEFIMSRTGKEIFESYISPDFSLSKRSGNTYEMVYRFIIPEKPFVDELIRFTVDSTGSIVEEREISGIPDCVNNPQSCRFDVDEQQARAIALQNGLEKGVNDWKVGFMWDAQLNQYVWHVLNTLYESEGSNGYIGNGREIVIDPASGLILRENKWNIR